jgi:hypothetical protein
MIVDDERPIATITDEELSQRAMQRTQLRIKYPGICAYFFELVMDIVIEEVIGWDIEKGKAREDIVGLFGVPEAFCAGIEEQGRRTLHGHIQVWVKEISKWREELHAENQSQCREARRQIIKSVNEVSSCHLFTECNGIAKAFLHVCTEADARWRQTKSCIIYGIRRDKKQKGESLHAVHTVLQHEQMRNWLNRI